MYSSKIKKQDKDRGSRASRDPANPIRAEVRDPDSTEDRPAEPFWSRRQGCREEPPEKAPAEHRSNHSDGGNDNTEKLNKLEAPGK